MTLDNLKPIIQSANLNFLIGSGCSVPFLGALGDIEVMLTDLNDTIISKDEKEIIRASILKNYYDVSIKDNLNLLDSTPETNKDIVIGNYNKLISSLYTILLYRRNNLLSKQINLFTTNMDLCIEVSSEALGIELNDGFKGRIKPTFDLTLFKKLQFKKSQLYDLVSEIPTLNCYKLHGSVNWKFDSNKIVLDSNLTTLRNLNSKTLTIGTDILEIFNGTDLKDIPTLATEVTGKTLTANTQSFLEEYDKLPIINPTKEKFKETTLNFTHYELIRIMSNELEKENSVLFVMGFSFADEHFQEIILRVANSNPTLKIIVFAYSSGGEQYIIDNLQLASGKNTYNNISFVNRENSGTATEENFDLENIATKYFEQLASDVKSNFSK